MSHLLPFHRNIGPTKAPQCNANRILQYCYVNIKLTADCSQAMLAVQNVLCCGLVYRNVKSNIYWRIILRVVLCGCETWSLTLRGKVG